MINKVTLVGRLGKDPEVRSLESGAKVATFTIATSESYKDKEGNWQDQTEWHNIVSWRGGAEQAERSFKKGNLVYVEGKLTTRKFTDKDNVERRTTEVVTSLMRTLEKRESADGSSYIPPPPPPSDNDAPIATAPSVDDDLPF